MNTAWTEWQRKCQGTSGASWSEAGLEETLHFKTYPIVLASRPLYTFGIGDLFQPGSTVPAPVTHQRQQPAIKAPGLMGAPS